MGTLQSSLESNRRTMIKIAIAVCLAALAAAEADADAFYGPYGYGYNMPRYYGQDWPIYSGNMWSMRHGYNYGKRSADAEPEADADAYYHPYMNWPMNSGFNMNYMNNWNMWNRYGMQQGYNSYSYGKRSADAEPKADAWYGPYGYSMNYMSYMNRPYNFYGYRYHF